MGADSQVHEVSAPPQREMPGGGLCKLSVFIRETDHYHHRPLYAEIVHRAHKTGLAGASAFRGVLGFSAPDYPRSRRWSLCEQVPVVIVVVDEKERIDAFLPLLDEVMDGGVAILESVQTRELRGGQVSPEPCWGNLGNKLVGCYKLTVGRRIGLGHSDRRRVAFAARRAVVGRVGP